jgi:predicted amidohydrolase YtcJ
LCAERAGSTADSLAGVSEAADLVITGARVRTLDPGAPIARAVAVRDGRIVAVGDEVEVRARCGRGTEVIDGRGRVVVPGLVDAHCHALWGARATCDADLTGAAGLEDALARLAAAAAQRPDDGWLLAHGLRREWFGGLLDGAVLDTAVRGRPAFVSFYDGHGALANPAALSRAGIDGPRTFCDASEIVCDDAGVPTGELREPSAMEAVRSQIPPLGAARRRALYRAQLERMAAHGLVAGHVMDDAPDDFADLAALEVEADLPVRLVVHVWLQPAMDDAQVADAIARAGESGRRWRSGAVKLFLDGVVDQGTAWLAAPDPYGRTTAPNWPDPARYAAVVARCMAAGLGCATHAIGDRAIRTALDAYAAPPGVQRVPRRIEHAELCDPRDVRRFAAGGVIASMQPIHVSSVVDAPESAWRGRLDSERQRWGWPCADLARAGVVLAFGSDWPVADLDPRLGLMWARRRRRAGGAGAGAGYREDQALDAEAALRAYTCGAAAAAGEPRGGIIAVGAPAELTVFGGDPVACAVDELPDLPIVATVVGGAVVHRSADA